MLRSVRSQHNFYDAFEPSICRSTKTVPSAQHIKILPSCAIYITACDIPFVQTPRLDVLMERFAVCTCGFWIVLVCERTDFTVYRLANVTKYLLFVFYVCDCFFLQRVFTTQEFSKTKPSARIPKRVSAKILHLFLMYTCKIHSLTTVFLHKIMLF